MMKMKTSLRFICIIGCWLGLPITAKRPRVPLIVLAQQQMQRQLQQQQQQEQEDLDHASHSVTPPAIKKSLSTITERTGRTEATSKKKTRRKKTQQKMKR